MQEANRPLEWKRSDADPFEQPARERWSEWPEATTLTGERRCRRCRHRLGALKKQLEESQF